jgi:hypothetical protein
LEEVLSWVLSWVEMLGDRRCLVRYEVDETERGSVGRWDGADCRAPCSE